MLSTSAVNSASCSKISTRRVVQVVCVFILLIVMALFLGYEDSNDEYLWKTQWNIISSPSFSDKKTMHLDDQYHVFHHACLESTGPHLWNILSSSKKTSENNKVIELFNFVGDSEFLYENFTVVEYDMLNESDINFQIQKGTYYLHGNTHANNYHVMNDFLLDIFNLYQKTELTGLIIPKGCDYCWTGRLPIQDLVLDMMNLTVLYSMEDLISNKTPPMCFDRLLLQRDDKGSPYHMREGRFSEFWPAEVFTKFRDSMDVYVRNLLELQDSVEYGLNNITNNTTDTNITVQNISSNSEMNQTKSIITKPVLSYMSRGSDEKCNARCVKNEQDVVAQLSKYFHVNVLDFSTGLTTLEALAYIQQTDVLIGLHGAGLAYTAFLPDKAMLIELKGEFGTRMFINMANTMNIPYYAISLNGCIGPGENDVFMIPSDSLYDMAEEIYRAFVDERQKLTDDGPSMTDGKCEFPNPVEPCGHLSSMDNSRCYLQQLEIGDYKSWYQCAWYVAC